jgi:dTDP-4-dehydrorhamnose 3,5-epimerase
MPPNKFAFGPTRIPGLFLIEPKVQGDHRGFFVEYYNHEAFAKAGIDLPFVQDNHSRSQKGVLRGLHFQRTHPQGKLIRVVAGVVFDVTVDLRKGSPTFGKWWGIELNAENHKMVYVPRGCAHGFLTLTDNVDFMYKCTDLYNPEDEGGLIWDDPKVGIEWPLDKVGGTVKLSERDKKWPSLDRLDVIYDFKKYKI